MMFKKLATTTIATLIICSALVAATNAATLSPALKTRINGLANTASAGVVIVSFNAPNGLTEDHLNILRNVGINKGVTFPKLGMVGAVLNAGQVRALAANSSVRSIWSNDRQTYYMNQARMLTGVDRIRTDSLFKTLNGGY